MMQLKKVTYNIYILLTVLGLSWSAHAQKKGKRTTINFEDQLIKGQNQKPDVLTIFKRKNLNHKRLIRLRENFIPEMRETDSEIDEGTQPKLRQKNNKEK